MATSIGMLLNPCLLLLLLTPFLLTPCLLAHSIYDEDVAGPLGPWVSKIKDILYCLSDNFSSIQQCNPHADVCKASQSRYKRMENRCLGSKDIFGFGVLDCIYTWMNKMASPKREGGGGFPDNLQKYENLPFLETK